jgi:hypothetical protein
MAASAVRARARPELRRHAKHHHASAPGRIRKRKVEGLSSRLPRRQLPAPGPATICWVWIPPGTPHAFTVTSGPARALNFYTPGGFDDQFSYLATPATQKTLPPDDLPSVDPGQKETYLNRLRVRPSGRRFGLCQSPDPHKEGPHEHHRSRTQRHHPRRQPHELVVELGGKSGQIVMQPGRCDLVDPCGADGLGRRGPTALGRGGSVRAGPPTALYGLGPGRNASHW